MALQVAEFESRSRREFGALVGGADEAVDLAHAALLIACDEYPDLDVPLYLARLDAMGAVLRSRVADEPRTLPRIEALNRFLFEELGFRGNATDYYDPRNSFLNDVLDRRLGIPITLATVYIEVGRRAGLRVEGVGLPGHFIAKVRGSEDEVLVDPFNAGSLLTEQDCQRRLDRVYGGRIKVLPAMLEACGRKYMLERMLRNLKGIYVKTQDNLRALRMVDLLLLVTPESAEDLRDRGLLFAALDCYRLAAADLEAYASLVPGTKEASELRDRVAALRRQAALLN